MKETKIVIIAAFAVFITCLFVFTFLYFWGLNPEFLHEKCGLVALSSADFFGLALLVCLGITGLVVCIMGICLAIKSK